MKNILILLTFFGIGFFQGCTTTSDIPEGYQDPRLRPYILDTVSLSKGKWKKEEFNDFRIYFKSRVGSVIGTCYLWANEIVIDPTYWATAKYYEKISTMIHEIVHCRCKIGHTEEKFEDGCPKSLMHPHSISAYCTEVHLKHYFTEIFERCP